MLAANASTSSLRGSRAFSASGPSLASRSLFLITFSLRFVSSSRCWEQQTPVESCSCFYYFVLCSVIVYDPLGLYLQETVHVGFHVGDGHPLHYDVGNAPFQTLPFVPSHSGGVNACRTVPVVRTAHTHSGRK